MKKTKKVVSLLLTIIMLTGFVTGCGSSESKSNTSDSAVSATGMKNPTASSKTYKLGISAYPAFYTWYIPQAEKFFEKNGVNVELVYFPVYSDSVQAFNSGKVDMISLAIPDAIAPYISGIEYETVLVLDNSNGADGLVGKKGINSISDLKGKSVATEYGTIEHFFLLQALQTAEMTEKDVNFVNLSISDSAPAFIAGTVDAACLWEPSLSKAQTLEGSKLLYSSENTPGLIPDVLLVSGDMARNSPDDIEAVINSYFDGMDFYVANEKQAIADMAKGAEITEDEMKVAMSGSRLFTVQECIDAMDQESESYSYLPYTTNRIAEFLHSVKMIDSVPDDTKKMFNSTYLKKVLEKRGSKPVPDTKK
ncbi:ABC transporter substrate-binding protein [Ruminiclostridium cellobioparum]|uniref:ABC transporter substrate-binding protein n=1 Tax=Ruminiclostridium cellobioparum TaxID=29355 RepID=UPI0004802688|nr:ABC transporter substrate-binding protein [Ruminiclostridium cellobioparum]